MTPRAILYSVAVTAAMLMWASGDTHAVRQDTAATPVRQDAAEAPEQVFRVRSDLVVLHVNVFDGKSDAVPGLPQSAFSITEDDQPQEVAFFSSSDVPVAAGLVLDNSGSMIARHAMVATGVRGFIAGSNPEDQLFAVVFNEHVRFGLPPTVTFTRNAVLMQTALRRFPAGGQTALFDAVVAAIDHLEEATHQKRVLIVLSDGEDNASRLSEREMLDKAQRSNAIIYAVSTATAGSADGSGNRRVLRRLADISGGLAYFPRSDPEVVQAFEEVAANIRRGYSLGYTPMNSRQDGGFRRVKVSVQTPGRKNLSVRVRDGYLGSARP